MWKNKVKRAPTKKHNNSGKENEPDIVNNSLWENILSDDITNVVGRRSGVGKRSLGRVELDGLAVDDVENNDEKEKQELKEREEKEKCQRENAAAKTKYTGINILNNLSQAELDEHYSKCIKLCNQNKVNVKNAFKLQLIDYMKLICMNQPSKTENLTLMSCTLDASAKIYSHRVDKVYNDMIIIVTGKNFGKDEESDAEDGEGKGGEDGGVVKSTPKKKDAGSSDEEEDNVAIKKLDMEKMLWAEGRHEKGKHEADLLDLPTLPTGLEYFLECPLADSDRLSQNPPLFPVSGHLEENGFFHLGDSVFNGSYDSFDIKEMLPQYRELHHHFTILGAGNGTEDLAKSSLAYDSTATSEIPETLRMELEMELDGGSSGDELEACQPDYDECLSDPEEGLGGPPQGDQVSSTGLEVPGPGDDSTAGVGSSRREGYVSGLSSRSFSVQNMARLVSATTSDFSYFDNSRLNLWAGPRHWTIKKTRDDNKSMKNVLKSSKKSNFIDFTMNGSTQKNLKKMFSETVSVVLAKKTLHSWDRSRCKVPQDIPYNQKKLLSLYKNAEIFFVKKDLTSDALSSANIKDVDGEEGVTLTPDDFGADAGDFEDLEENGEDMGHPEEDDDPGGRLGSVSPDADYGEQPSSHQSSALVAIDLIPAPAKVNKININYAKTQKRIDMKLLKSTIWKSLNLKPEEKDGQEVRFSEVFYRLPGQLPREEAAELSFPIAFMALLHMANEKTLALRSTDNMDDIFVSLG